MVFNLQWISNYLWIGEYLQRQIAIRGHNKARAKAPLFQISTTSTNACQKLGQYRRFRWVDVSIERAILNQWSGSRWTPPKTGSFKNAVFCVK